MSPLIDELEARVAAIDRYVPGRVLTQGAPDEPGKLSGNEHVYRPAPSVLAAVAASARRAGRYPDAGPLRTRLADLAGVDVANVIVTNGSDEVCVLLARLLRPGDAVVCGAPGYRMDEIVSLGAGAEVRKVGLVEGAHDVDAMLAVSHGALLLWLPNPHNPTGRAIPVADLRRLVAAAPPECMVVIDEAYRDFMDDDWRPNTVALIAEHPNLVAQRTLSKSAALAGLRVGYAIADARLIAVLEAFRPPFNVNAVAIGAALAALDNPAWSALTVRLVRRERDRLHRALDELGIEHWRSQGNFVTVQAGERAPALHAALGRAGVVARDGGDLGVPGCVRITIGAPPQMLLVRRALAEVFAMRPGATP